MKTLLDTDCAIGKEKSIGDISIQNKIIISFSISL